MSNNILDQNRILNAMLCQLMSYEVKSVRVCDISELSLVPSISVSSYYINVMFCGVMYSGEGVCW